MAKCFWSNFKMTFDSFFSKTLHLFRSSILIVYSYYHTHYTLYTFDFPSLSTENFAFKFSSQLHWIVARSVILWIAWRTFSASTNNRWNRNVSASMLSPPSWFISQYWIWQVNTIFSFRFFSFWFWLFWFWCFLWRLFTTNMITRKSTSNNIFILFDITRINLFIGVKTSSPSLSAISSVSGWVVVESLSIGKDVTKPNSALSISSSSSACASVGIDSEKGWIIFELGIISSSGSS